jgi:hypothetical protein
VVVSGLARLLVALALWVALSGPATVAQAPPLETDDPSPANRHAQVIAHGVAEMPADEVGWRLTVVRAVPPTRAEAEERPAGFILAGKGVVALVDQSGKRLARIAPGEAIWNEPGAMRAVVGLERKAPDYYDIALVPATSWSPEPAVPPPRLWWRALGRKSLLGLARQTRHPMPHLFPSLPR